LNFAAPPYGHAANSAPPLAGRFFSAPPRNPSPEIPSGDGTKEEIMDEALRKAKLSKLIEIEGYDDIEQLAKVVLSDAVSPAICMNEDCNFTCEMEPDQDAGYCQECHTNTMTAALVLAELI
jgi:hypothetical protein